MFEPADMSAYLATKPTASHLRNPARYAAKAQEQLDSLDEDSIYRTALRLNHLQKKIDHAPCCGICCRAFTFTEVQMYPGMCCHRDRAIICHPSIALEKHIFHESCLATWIAQKANCATCREELVVPRRDIDLVRDICASNPDVMRYVDGRISALADDDVADRLMGWITLLRDRVLLYAQGFLVVDEIEYCPYVRMELPRRAQDNIAKLAVSTIDATSQTTKLWAWFFSNVILFREAEPLDAFNHPLAIILFAFVFGQLQLHDGFACSGEDFRTLLEVYFVSFEDSWPKGTFERPRGWTEFKRHFLEQVVSCFVDGGSADAWKDGEDWARMFEGGSMLWRWWMR
ncbi:hypothetical protein DOTSEDRAFT_35070 [Dothistroma septosporum NZE10]|uniref:RING-type domain-containing protein n=1 Tax=Dothistroma septosporum (strain NZE10 / CBS 128990) TaxID=675120 RepID=N1PMN5_DOTSN|nr:hypothetical protein DOTSEDRAFT_35070 [Dothistroma septosporum NZE10]